VGGEPRAVYFKPQGVPMTDLQAVILPVEGLEALRLADLERLEHDQAAAQMGISRPTFSRVLTEARSRVSLALVNGWVLRIEGGDYQVAPEAPAPTQPPGGGGGFGRGRGRGRRRGQW